MSPEEELAVRKAVQEAFVSIVPDLQQTLKQAVDGALQEALPPALAACMEEMRTQTPSGSFPASPGNSMPKMRRKLSNVSSLAVEITSLRRHSLQIAPRVATLPSQFSRQLGLANARSESISSFDAENITGTMLSGGRSEQLAGTEEEPDVAEGQDEEDLQTDALHEFHALPLPSMLPSMLPSHLTGSSRSARSSSRDRPGSEEDRKSPRSDSEQSDIDCDGPAEGITKMQSMMILPEALASPKQQPQSVPAWRRILRSILKPFTCTRKPAAKANQSQVRRILLKNQSHAMEIPGRPGRRSGVVLVESEVQRLSRRPSERICQWSWPFSDPSGRPRQYWEISACVLHLLQLLYLCFQAAFITNADYQDLGYVELKTALLVVDFFWVLDLGMNFTTGYRDDLHLLHNDTFSNARRYLRSWFFCDLLATMPSLVLHVHLVLDSSTYAFWPLRLLSLTPILRSFRFRYALAMLRRLEANMKSSLASSAWWLFQLFMLPIVFSHLSACALWSLGSSNLEADAGTSSWIKLGLDIPNEPNALQSVPLGERYATAMYFAITVMSTVGLGDISTSLPNERALLCIIMAITSLVVGVAVNGVSTIVSKLSEKTAANMEQLAQVARFLKAYRVPSELQSRVHDYLLQVFENREREETKAMLMGCLKKSEVLRVKVNMSLTGTCLTQHRWLKLLPPEVLANVCDICDTEFHPPGQELITEGAMVKSCFYIRSGSLTTRQSRLIGPATQVSQAWSATSENEHEDDDEIQKEIEAADGAGSDERLKGGTFIGDFRLFLGMSRSWRTVNCLSFSELISIDVLKFQSLMSSELPELFDVLVIYSAIDHDCPKAMLHCLKEQGIAPEMPLLFGESALHHCAKVNAAACAEHFLQNLGTDAVQVLDEEGYTPAQLAAALKHKETFWALLQCSESSRTVTDADVLTRETHAHAQTTIPVWAEEDHLESYTPARVRDLFDSCNMHSAGVLGAFRRDGAKSMEDLVTELNTCQSSLVVVKQSLLRRVRLVRLRLLAAIDESVCVLVELQSDRWLKAPDQKLGKLPQRRIRRSETELEATKQLMQELGISEDLLEDKLVVQLAKTCHVETRTSMSYPGLETEYTVCESTWKIRAEALLTAKEIGLPNGKPFTRELGAQPLQMVCRQFFWPSVFNYGESAQADNGRDEEPGQQSGSLGMSINPLRALLWRAHS